MDGRKERGVGERDGCWEKGEEQGRKKGNKRWEKGEEGCEKGEKGWEKGEPPAHPPGMRV